MGSCPAYYKGIICAAAYKTTNTKGQALGAFIDAIKWTPKKVIFFDDNRKNIESVVNEMRKRKIICYGFWYLGVFVPAKGTIDKDLISFQFEYLKKYDEIIGDTKAIELMKKNKSREKQVAN